MGVRTSASGGARRPSASSVPSLVTNARRRATAQTCLRRASLTSSWTSAVSYPCTSRSSAWSELVGAALELGAPAFWKDEVSSLPLPSPFFLSNRQQLSTAKQQPLLNPSSPNRQIVASVHMVRRVVKVVEKRRVHEVIVTETVGYDAQEDDVDWSTWEGLQAATTQARLVQIPVTPQQMKEVRWKETHVVFYSSYWPWVFLRR